MPDENRPSDVGAGDNFSNALNSILSNPEMLSMITSMAKQLKSDAQQSEPSGDGDTSAPPSSPASAAQPEHGGEPSVAAALSSLAPLLSGEGIKHSKRDNDRACLLRALKPYLSHERAEAIDYIIRFSSLAEVLKNLS